MFDPNICIIFLRPGHGAPTGDIRKKKFTEHQINKGMTRSQSTFSLDDAGDFIGIPAAPLARFSSETELQAGVRKDFLHRFHPNIMSK